MTKKKQEAIWGKKNKLTPEERAKELESIKRWVGFLGIFLIVVGAIQVSMKAAIFIVIGLACMYFGFLNKFKFNVERR